MSPVNPFERFTQDARVALQVGEQLARKQKTPLSTDHLLVAFLENPQTLIYELLQSIGISLENVYISLQGVGLELVDEKLDNMSIPMREVVESSFDIAQDCKHNFVGSEHLLMSILNHKENNAVKIFDLMSVNRDNLEKDLFQLLKQISGKDATSSEKNTSEKKGSNPLEDLFHGLSGAIGIMKKGDGPFGMIDLSDSAKMKGKQFERDFDEESFFDDGDLEDSLTPALDFFSTDFTALAKKEELDPVIGRKTEIERIIHILNRKTKNNPVIIGEPGVGKTAVVEGLSQAIYNGEVPSGLLNKRVLSLDIAGMVAGTKYRGEFEERLKEVIEDAISSNGEVIIFIDEIHTIVGAGSGEGTLDAANILKPALSRGKVQVIGATTFDEYRKYIEKDKALERRFQPVQVNEPSEPEAIEVLQGIRKNFEKYHKLNIDSSALEASVRLSKRFLPDRFLPDKAIDVLDESCAGKGHRSQKQSKEIRNLEKKLKDLLKKKEDFVQNNDYEKALKLKEKEERYEEEIQKLRDIEPSVKNRITITDQDIESTISRITGVPIEKLQRGDVKKLLSLESVLQKKVIGQKNAIEKITKAVQRSRTGIANPNRPMGVFLFLGPTGVGKTELVKVLADEIYGRPESLIKIDMSEFMEKHSTSRLVGATAGYVGYEDGGELTEKVRRNPYSLILFDEIEKAHRDFQNMLLQVFEDGYLTDSKGRKVDFRNTIIVLTSNIGAEILTESANKIGFAMPISEEKKAEEDFEEKSSLVLDQLKKHFRPEFLGRVDKTVIFKPLNKKSVRSIVKLQLAELNKRMHQQKLSLSYSDAVITFLAKKSFDNESGARKVRNIIQEYVEDGITNLLLHNEIPLGSTLKILCKRGKTEGLMIEISE